MRPERTDGTYLDVRLSTDAGVLLGIFEITVFVALSNE